MDFKSLTQLHTLHVQPYISQRLKHDKNGTKRKQKNDAIVKSTT